MLIQRQIVNNRGFTLMELLVTVAILGTIATIGILGTQGMRQSYAARAVARRVYSDMQMARMKAIKEGRNATVDFDGTTGAYSIIFNSATLKNVDLRGDFPDIKVCVADDAPFRANGTVGGGGIRGIHFSIGKSTKKVYVSSTGTGNVRIKSETCP